MKNFLKEQKKEEIHSLPTLNAFYNSSPVEPGSLRAGLPPGLSIYLACPSWLVCPVLAFFLQHTKKRSPSLSRGIRRSNGPLPACFWIYKHQHVKMVYRWSFRSQGLWDFELLLVNVVYMSPLWRIYHSYFVIF